MEALQSLNVSFAVELIVKSTILLGLTLLATFLARKAPASAQHLLWAFCFAALLALPILTYGSAQDPSWRLSIPILEPTPAPEPAPVLTSRPAPSEPSRRAITPPAPQPSPTMPESSFPWRGLWIAVWLTGSFLLLARLAVGLVSGYRTRRNARSLDEPAWLDMLDDARERIGVRRRVGLRQNREYPMPLTMGIFRPTILLPDAAESYSFPRRSAVLLHELAHVLRRDCLTQLMSQATCALYWWHPLAWIGARHMRLLSERASDDLVLDAGTRPDEYAHDLLDMARALNEAGRAGESALASVTMAHRSRLEDRLLAILDPKLARGSVTGRLAFIGGACFLAIATTLALAIPTRAISIAPPPSSEASLPQAEPEVQAEPEPEAQPEPSTDAKDRAREALAEALDDPEPSVREQALHALMRLGDKRTIPYLEEALTSGTAEMRAEAAWGLGQMRHQEAASTLAKALSDEDEQVREQAAWSLGMLRSEEATTALSDVLTNDASANAREQAAWALGMIRSDSAVVALVSALSDSSSNVREQAAWAAGMVRSDGAVDGLVAALNDDSENVRSQAAWALGMIRDDRAVAGLGRALQDSSEDVREQAIWAIGMLRSRESYDILVGALDDTNAEIRSQAVWALGMLRDSRAVEPLTELLRDEDADVREQAAWAIGLIVDGDDDRDFDGDVDLEDLELGELELDLEMDEDPDPDPDPEPRRGPRARLMGAAL